jgi:hypothetical protein
MNNLKQALNVAMPALAAGSCGATRIRHLDGLRGRPFGVDEEADRAYAHQEHA